MGSTDNFKFADWQITASKNLLVKEGSEIHVEPKVMQLLVCLARANGEVVSRDDLMDAVWPRLVVGDVLNNTVANLRKALGDTRTPRLYIDTIPKQGYRLIPEVSWETEPAGIAATDKQQPQKPHEQAGLDRSTNQSFFSGKPLAGLGFLLVLVLLIVYNPFNPDVPEQIKATESEGIKTLAVLPFDTFSNQSDIKNFAGGLVEELIHQLAANPELRVIARTSSSVFRGSGKDIKEISGLLGARFIMEGSIRQSSDELRVTVQLIDAQDGFHLWSRTYDHNEGDNILDTQIAIGEKVTALLLSGNAEERIYQNRKHPQSAEAYRLFLIAQSHMKNLDVAQLELALDYYQRAIDIAPDYGLAYTGLAAAHLLLYQYNHVDLPETIRLSSEALKKAFETEPNLAEAFAVRGLQKTYELQYVSAQQDFMQAIELNPGLRFARHNFGFMLWSLNRPGEALPQFEIALKMDPLSSITNFAVGDVLGSLGELDKAINHYLRCQEVIPDDYSCYLGLATTYKLMGDFEQFNYYLSLAEQRTSGDNFWIMANKAWRALILGELEESNTILQSTLIKNPQNIDLLRLSFLLNLKTSSPDAYEDQIKQLIIENPTYYDLNLLLGQTSYFKSNCALAITQYNQAMRENDDSLIDLWDFSLGTSHILNLAFCYQTQGHSGIAETFFEKYHQFSLNLPTATQQIPGKIYNDARYLQMTGYTDEAQSLLQDIQDWPFAWLYNEDPVWH